MIKLIFLVLLLQSCYAAKSNCALTRTKNAKVIDSLTVYPSDGLCYIESEVSGLGRLLAEDYLISYGTSRCNEAISKITRKPSNSACGPNKFKGTKRMKGSSTLVSLVCYPR